MTLSHPLVGANRLANDGLYESESDNECGEKLEGEQSPSEHGADRLRPPAHGTLSSTPYRADPSILHPYTDGHAGAIHAAIARIGTPNSEAA